jgi:hypothetical protein
MDQTIEVKIIWVELRGGPADGGQLPIPDGSYGDIVVHHTPSKRDGGLGPSIGYAALYHREAGNDYATFDEDHENPSDESKDWDLPQTRPYAS